MAKIIEKVVAVATGWGGLKKAVEKQDDAAVRKMLTDHQVDERMADILMMVLPEAAKLQAVIDDNAGNENGTALELEMSTLRRINPTTPTQAVDVAKAIEDCRRRQDKTWFGQFQKSAAEGDLYNLKITFSELFDGGASTQFCGTTNAIDAKMRELGLVEALSQSTSTGGWRDIFKLSALSQPQRRRRLVAR